jgi:hypothetical protein
VDGLVQSVSARLSFGRSHGSVQLVIKLAIIQGRAQISLFFTGELNVLKIDELKLKTLKTLMTLKTLKTLKTLMTLTLATLARIVELTLATPTTLWIWILE